MSSGPQLFRVNPESWESDRVEEVDFSRLGLQERRDIQELDRNQTASHKRADSAGILAGMASHTLNDGFSARIAELLRRFIEEITPIVDDLENEAGEVEV